MAGRKRQDATTTILTYHPPGLDPPLNTPAPFSWLFTLLISYYHPFFNYNPLTFHSLSYFKQHLFGVVESSVLTRPRCGEEKYCPFKKYPKNSKQQGLVESCNFLGLSTVCGHHDNSIMHYNISDYPLLYYIFTRQDIEKWAVARPTQLCYHHLPAR